MVGLVSEELVCCPTQSDTVSPALCALIRVAQKAHTASMSRFRALMRTPIIRRSGTAICGAAH